VLYQWNEIQLEACKEIAEALAVNRSLCELYLDCNSIGDAGAQALLNSFADHPSLNTVSVYVCMPIDCACFWFVR
jgi:hypothetical protein